LLFLLFWAIGSLNGWTAAVVKLLLAEAIAVFVVSLCGTGLGRAASTVIF
jgi:hypothetical protein